jgi:hypothetical protein
VERCMLKRKIVMVRLETAAGGESRTITQRCENTARFQPTCPTRADDSMERLWRSMVTLGTSDGDIPGW